jgi:hypothetical protein
MIGTLGWILIIVGWFSIGFFWGRYFWFKYFGRERYLFVAYFFSFLCGLLGPIGAFVAWVLYKTS